MTALILASPVFGGDWSQFRGPGGRGCSDDSGLPLEWSPTKNITWRTEVPGKGWSSPVVADGKVFLTTAVKISEQKSNDRSLRALCYDAASGKELWNVEVFVQKDADVADIHAKNSHASSSPVVDGRQVFVHFGPQGTAALSTEGKILWRNHDFQYDPEHGNGGSPILVDDMLIFNCDGADETFIVALDRDSGQVRWKKPRPERPNKLPRTFSFSTPTAIEVDGRPLIVSPSTDQVLAYDLQGEVVWRVRYLGYSVVPLPIYAKGLVFIVTGWNHPALAGIKPGGRGDVTKSHVVWQTNRNVPHTPSVLAVEDELYFISDRGVASCVDALTGKMRWRRRLGGGYSASPIHADGKVIFCNEEGIFTVVAPGKSFKELARNDMQERILATPAIADSAIFLRTEKALYRVGAR